MTSSAPQSAPGNQTASESAEIERRLEAHLLIARVLRRH